MTPNRIALLAFVLMVIGAAVTIQLRRRAALHREAERLRKENLELQEFALSKLDEVGRLLDRADISSSELKSKSEAVFAEMEARGLDGRFDALIADSRAFIQEQIDKQAPV